MMNQANRVNYEPHCWFLFYTLGSCLCLHTNSGGEQSREKKILTWFPFFFSFSFHIFIVWNKWGHECRIKIMKDKGWEIKSSGERESGFFWIMGVYLLNAFCFFFGINLDGYLAIYYRMGAVTFGRNGSR